MDTVFVALLVGTVFIVAERIRPNVALERVEFWYARALVFNAVQAAIAVAGTHLWDRWFADVPLLVLDTLPVPAQVAVGYLVITFVYYWWHRARHHSSFLWRYLHQFHHSPVRIEVVTSFYKNPLEIVLNGMLSSAILYVLLGLTATAVGYTVLLTALAEFVYHMNIKTPRAMGLFFQRPEMHRIHHGRGVHHYNYSDLPLWDMLFGTYRNPETADGATGFPDGNELRVGALLRGEEVAS